MGDADDIIYSMMKDSWFFPGMIFISFTLMYFVPFAVMIYSLNHSVEQRLDINKQLKQRMVTMNEENLTLDEDQT